MMVFYFEMAMVINWLLLSIGVDGTSSRQVGVVAMVDGVVETAKHYAFDLWVGSSL